MDLSKDLREFIQSLNDNKVKYLIVGGYAVSYHGYPRYTKDIDIWVYLEENNASKMILALKQFGFPTNVISKDDFLDAEAVIQLGYPPNRIDILTDLDAIAFDDCFKNKEEVDLNGVLANFIDIDNLIITKKATGRDQDLLDAKKLETARKE